MVDRERRGRTSSSSEEGRLSMATAFLSYKGISPDKYRRTGILPMQPIEGLVREDAVKALPAQDAGRDMQYMTAGQKLLQQRRESGMERGRQVSASSEASNKFVESMRLMLSSLKCWH